MLQYRLLRLSPALLRWYRTRLTLDWERLSAFLPRTGRLLDVGCGVGSLDYEIARAHRQVHVLGIDVDGASVAMAREFHALPNAAYQHTRLENVEGVFDCVLFVDVFHHVPPEEHTALLEQCRRLLAPGGYVLIKDIERRRGQVSWLLDRYVSGCERVWLQDREELARTIAQVLSVRSISARYRFPFPHYYVTAEVPQAGAVPHRGAGAPDA